MATTSAYIIREVQRNLNDLNGDRYPATDVAGFVNRAQRDIHSVRPDVTASNFTFIPVAGAKQALPQEASVLIDVPANAEGNQRRITKVDMEMLDASEPNWRSKQGSIEIKHFMHDLRIPRSFWLYPPAAATGVSVELEASLYPIDITQPTGAVASTATGNISLRDEWATALIFVSTSYAMLTDLEGEANPSLASSYLARAEQLLGVQLQSSAAVAPKN